MKTYHSFYISHKIIYTQRSCVTIMFKKIKEKMTKKKEQRLIRKMVYWKKALDRVYEYYDGKVMHCPNCRALLNMDGDFDTSDPDDIKVTCRICGYETNKIQGPFIEDAMNEICMIRESRYGFFDFKVIKNSLDKIDKCQKKYRLALLDLRTFYRKRDGYISRCPLCHSYMNQYGVFNVWKEILNPYDDRTMHNWCCYNCGNTSVWKMEEGKEPRLLYKSLKEKEYVESGYEEEFNKGTLR